MKNAIRELERVSSAYRSMTTPNSQTVTEYTANENKKRVVEIDYAIEVLRAAMDKWVEDSKRLYGE